MLRSILASLTLVLALGCLGGCGSQPQWEPNKAENLFKPTAMRLHPVFTQIHRSAGGQADGIEALIEFQDQFSDPAKASGNVVFELYEYRPGYPDPRGNRVVTPFLASLDNVAAQRDRWSRTSRCYTFELMYPQINPAHTYVLTCTFEMSGGGRFYDQLVLEPPRRSATSGEPAGTKPTQEPGARKQAP